MNNKIISNIESSTAIANISPINDQDISMQTPKPKVPNKKATTIAWKSDDDIMKLKNENNNSLLSASLKKRMIKVERIF